MKDNTMKEPEVAQGAYTAMPHKEIFDTCLTGNDVKDIANAVGCSINTIYRYLRVGVPNTGIAERTAQDVCNMAKDILIKRSQLLLKTLK